MMDSSPSKVNVQPSLPPIAGVKRPAPSLLPAFEPFSSSPGFPRPSKRRAPSPGNDKALFKYPTPLPTSATGILSSSPPRLHQRPGLKRTQSSVSERAPLAAVNVLILPENGDEVRMGRSSNSSDYQLSANRLISRVHVKARYIAATSVGETNKVEIVCTGWNGVKVRCHGKTWELAKGDSFTSETASAEIMLDVQDARVMIGWPRPSRKASPSDDTDSSWDDNSPSRRRDQSRHAFESSPLGMQRQRIVSPDSPTPAGSQQSATSLPGITSSQRDTAAVEVYEDRSSPEKDAVNEDLDTQRIVGTASQDDDFDGNVSSDLSDVGEEDPDEENDPIIHSFGPFGADISSRMESFTTKGSPLQRASPKHAKFDFEYKSAVPLPNEADKVPIVNHVVNQLAFSRLSSTPLSVILNHLPEELRRGSSHETGSQGLSKDELHKMLFAAVCIGEIRREGKDAAGKRLESEFYYIPDADTDEQRKAAVVDGLRKPSLRNCRKQHKVSSAI